MRIDTFRIPLFPFRILTRLYVLYYSNENSFCKSLFLQILS